MQRNSIRNFSIIAHIDHGKSTLADRMLEITGTIEKRRMRDQVLDSMELERERGITIKMQPVRILFKRGSETYTLNLIDTPGHIDFSYEVSRALSAVEGAVLLVDATQGIQAQTLTTLSMARELGLVIIPAISKVDSPLADVERVRGEIASMLGCDPDSILTCSGKTGEGVEVLLSAIVDSVPPPEAGEISGTRALVFDFSYSEHRGVIVYVRLTDGRLQKGEKLRFLAAKRDFNAIEVGIFAPEERPTESLSAGEIGYIVTGVKEPGIASVGDTISLASRPLGPFSDYTKPSPVVFASVYPESQDDFVALRQALLRLKLSDSSLSFEEEASGTLGRGFRCGFLGMLHLEIITERLRREFNLSLIVATPTITYDVVVKGGKRTRIYSPVHFPDYGLIEEIYEPWILAKIIAPEHVLGPVMQILYDHEAEVGDSTSFGDGRVLVTAKMPLRELMRGFFDRLKTASSGFASLSYEPSGERKADVARLDLLVADEIIPAFSRVVSKRRVEEESKAAVERLYSVLPRQMFVTKIQAQALGRIVSSKTLSALRKDVTGYLYGGDITRKMKLLEKQKRGKKKMAERGTVNIPQDVFLKMMRSGE